MELVTHTVVSLAAGSAGLSRNPRELALVLISGIIADLDRLSWWSGPLAYLEFRGYATHSLLASLMSSALLAGLFWWPGRRASLASLSYFRAFLLSAVAAAVHLALDLCSVDGITPWWPFRPARVAWDLVAYIDPWIFGFLALGLLLPGLFRLITEEIGARTARRGPQRGALLALAALVLYLIGRGYLQGRALETLGSRMYHAAAPVAVGAYPSPVSPWLWRGVVETDNTLEEIEVSTKSGSFFNPDLSHTYYKPESGAPLEASRSTRTVSLFLQRARFPIARIEKTEFGWRVELRDLRHSINLWQPGGFLAVVDLDAQLKVLHEELRLVDSR